MRRGIVLFHFVSAQICNRLVFYVPLQPTFISVIAAPEIEIFGFEQWHALFTSECAISGILIVGKNHFQTKRDCKKTPRMHGNVILTTTG